MSILIETDIGQDPDDLFALLYLLSSGADIKAIVLSPGDSFQVAITRFLLKECGREDIPVGTSPIPSDLKRKTRFHYSVIEKYGCPENAKADGYGPDMMREMRDKYPDIEFFLIGPIFNMKEYLESKDAKPIKRIVMQGGFVPSCLMSPYRNAERFESKSSFTTFNLCSYPEGGQLLFDAEMNKAFITKNLCNTLFYNVEKHKNLCSFPAKNRAYELFQDCGDILLSNRKDKRLHDVYAAVYLLHPEIFGSFKGKLFYDKQKCSCYCKANGDNIVVDVNENTLWDYINQGI